jgi:hypothetical protein
VPSTFWESPVAFQRRGALSIRARRSRRRRAARLQVPRR